MIVIKETMQILALSVAVLTGLIAMYKLIKFQAFRPIINLNLEADVKDVSGGKYVSIQFTLENAGNVMVFNDIDSYKKWSPLKSL